MSSTPLALLSDDRDDVTAEKLSMLLVFNISKSSLTQRQGAHR